MIIHVVSCYSPNQCAHELEWVYLNHNFGKMIGISLFGRGEYLCRYLRVLCFIDIVRMIGIVTMHQLNEFVIKWTICHNIFHSTRTSQCGSILWTGWSTRGNFTRARILAPFVCRYVCTYKTQLCFVLTCALFMWSWTSGHSVRPFTECVSTWDHRAVQNKRRIIDCWPIYAIE